MSIVLKTAIPGPKSQALMERRRAAIARGPFHSTPIFMQRGQGAVIEDVDGNHLLDFACGIGVTNLGHAPETVVEAAREQMGQVLHAQFNVTPHESAVRLAEALNRVTPGGFAKKTLLVNSGAEAVENAIKIARTFTKRQAVVCFDHAYHGRTYMAMALTAKVKPYKYGFAPFPSEIYRAPFPYLYRSEEHGDEAAVSQIYFSRFEEMIASQISADQVAAVILEPVLGEGGFLPVPKVFFQKLREYCTQNGIVLIADEVQSGFGRTGTLFACEQLGVAPDLITLAKGLGGGLPIAAVTGRAEIMDAPSEGGVGGTYGGNPVACAAALAVIETFADPQTLTRARAIGEQIEARLHQWKQKYPVIGDVRGLGPMRGIELVKDRKSKTPNKDAAGAWAKYCHTNGVVVLTAGTFGNVIRLLVPLVITDAQLTEGLDVMEAGLAKLS